MLNRTSCFLVLAVIAGILGADSILGEASPVARILCVIFLASFLISYLWKRRPPLI